MKQILTFARLLTCSIAASKVKIRAGRVNHRVGWKPQGCSGSNAQGSVIHNPLGSFLRGSHWVNSVEHHHHWPGQWDTTHPKRLWGRQQQRLAVPCRGQSGWAMLTGQGQGWSPSPGLLQPHPVYSSFHNQDMDRSNHESVWRSKILRVQAGLAKPNTKISLDADSLRKRWSDWGARWGKIKVRQDCSLH